MEEGSASQDAEAQPLIEEEEEEEEGVEYYGGEEGDFDEMEESASDDEDEDEDEDTRSFFPSFLPLPLTVRIFFRYPRLLQGGLNRLRQMFGR